MGIIKDLFKKKYVVRAHRFSVKKIHNISMSVEGKKYVISNISMSGVGLNSSALSSTEKENDEILLTLQIGGDTFDVLARIVRIKGDFIGLAITGHLKKYEQNVKKFFQGEINALKLVKRESKELIADYGEEIEWFYSDDFHELVSKTKGETLIFFRINYQGLIFNYDTQVGLKTFQVIDSLEKEVETKLGSNIEIMSFDIQNPQMFLYVIRFIDAATILENSTRNQIIEALEISKSKLI